MLKGARTMVGLLLPLGVVGAIGWAVRYKLRRNQELLEQFVLVFGFRPDGPLTKKQQVLVEREIGRRRDVCRRFSRLAHAYKSRPVMSRHYQLSYTAAASHLDEAVRLARHISR